MRPILFLLLIAPVFGLAQFTDTRIIQTGMDNNAFSLLSPLSQTPDGGFIFSHSAAFWTPDGGDSYETYVVKMDSAFTPVWSKSYQSGNGRSPFVLPNGNIIAYGSDYELELYCFNSSGEQLWSTLNNHVPASRSIKIMDAVLEGSILRFAGQFHNNNNSSIVNAAIIEIDTLGNFIGSDSIHLAGYTRSRLERISPKLSDGSYYISGCAKSGANWYNFVSKRSSSNDEIWTKNIQNSPVDDHQQTAICPHSTGSVYHAANYFNPAIPIANNQSMSLTKFDNSGTVAWTKTVDEISEASELVELPNGHLLLSGEVHDVDSYVTRATLIELDIDGNVIWAKRYDRNYWGISSIPYFKSADEWYFSYLSYSNGIAFTRIDSVGNNDCQAIDYIPVFRDVTFTFSNATATFHSGPGLAINTFHPNADTHSISYSHMCTAYPSDTLETVLCKGDNYMFADSTTYENIQLPLSHTSILTGQAADGADSLVVEIINLVAINTDIVIADGVLTAQETDAQYQWVDCSTNEPIENATEQSYVPPTGGSYAVEITAHGCTYTSPCTSVEFLAIEEHRLLAAIRPYPNPTNGRTIWFTSPHSLSFAFVLYNVDGQILLEQNISDSSQLIALPETVSGMYLYAITQGAYQTHGKIVISN